MATDIRAELKNCGVSAQKARLVIDLVRGKPAVEALTTLKFTNKVQPSMLANCLLRLLPMLKRTLVSAVKILLSTRSLLMKPPPASGAALVPVAASSRYCAALLT